MHDNVTQTNEEEFQTAFERPRHTVGLSTCDLCCYQSLKDHCDHCALSQRRIKFLLCTYLDRKHFQSVAILVISSACRYRTGVHAPAIGIEYKRLVSSEENPKKCRSLLSYTHYAKSSSALAAVLSMAVLAVVASPVLADVTLRQFDHLQTRDTSSEWNILDRRGKRATACDCKVMVKGKLTGNTYIAPVVQQTLDRAMELTKKKQTLGTNAYPHAYNNHEALKFPGCKGTNLMEYPLLKKGGASGSPEADRIVYDAKGNFCGCMTHEGVQGNAFQLCKS